MNISVVAASVLLGVVLAGGGLYGCPQYEVYSAKMSGQAQYAEAMSTRQTAVLEAQARFESAKYDAQAEIERAKGTQQANNTVISSFGSTDERLKYLQIEALKETKDQIIYVPTDGLLPVTEAGRAAK